MCGILSILNLDPARSNAAELRRQALAMARKIRHRGPDWSGIFSDDHAILVHERLSIVDVEHGAQPLIDTLQGTVLAVNGLGSYTDIGSYLAACRKVVGRDLSSDEVSALIDKGRLFALGS